MHCPKCGHQQASYDMRFCSRCGFKLAGVAELLANEGIVTAPPEEQHLRASRLSRRGAKFIFFSILIAPIFLLLSYAFDAPEPLFVPFFLFLAGVAQIAYKRIFSENLLPESCKKNEVGSKEKEQYLPPATSVPAASLFRRETNDLAPPPSITESTTRLLEREPGFTSAKTIVG